MKLTIADSTQKCKLDLLRYDARDLFLRIALSGLFSYSNSFIINLNNKAMDKRTIFFVLLVGISFFGLNLFFSHQRDVENREHLKLKDSQESKILLQQKADVEKKTAHLDELPVVELKNHSEETIAYGIQLEEAILSLTWQVPPTKEIVVGQKIYYLISKEAVVEGPILYVTDNFKSIAIANLPSQGSHDLQLITFPEGGRPKVFWGIYKEGDIAIPQGPIFENALVLYKTNQDQWLPLGFYESRGKLMIELQNLPLITPYIKNLQQQPSSSSAVSEQRFYVLENDFQQIVFSNVGGAIVEMNLPYESQNDDVSVVKEIGFDREIAHHHAANAHFPAHPYYTFDSKEPHAPKTIGGYYPLLRRGIWNSKTIEISPQFYALNIVSEYPEMAELIYSIKEFTATKIVFEALQPHRKITKTYTLPPGHSGAPYCFDLNIQIEGDSRGLWLTSGIPEVEIISNNSSPQLQYRITRKGKSDVQKIDLPKAKELLSISSIHPDWVANSNGYMGMIIDPLTQQLNGMRALGIMGTQAPTRLSVIDPQYAPYPASKYPGYQIQLPLPTSNQAMHFRIYSGPFEESVLKAVDRTFADPQTGYNPDYVATWTFYGWFSFISEPFAKFLFIVMKFFHFMTGSWGFSIILLTVFLRLLLYPLNAWSIKSMRRMQQLSPQIQAIQAKHKKEPKKAQMEIMMLYKDKKVNPFTGCIPILIQIPFLIAMFDLLKSSFQLRGASFIPGWIDDLTAPDVLFQWKAPIFFIGNQLHLLPILLGAVMFIQQRFFSATPADPNKMTDQQRQQKAMGTIMTAVFTVMFYHFPSGLNLYWLSSMVLGILQQWVTNRILDKKKNDVEILTKNSDVKKKLAPKKAK